MASLDIGDMGPAEGAQVIYHWPLVLNLAMGLPWLILLALLCRRANRNARAWAVWIPLLITQTPFCALACLAERAQAPFNLYAPMLMKVAMLSAAFAALWLTADWIAGARRRREVAIRAATIALAAVLVNSLALTALDFSAVLEEMIYGALAMAAALVAIGWAGKRCGEALRPAPFVALTCLLACLVYAIGTILSGAAMLVPMLIDGRGMYLLVALVSAGIGGGMVGAVHAAILLPYLILAFTNALYRERIERALGLPPSAPPPSPAEPLDVPAEAPEARGE